MKCDKCKFKDFCKHAHGVATLLCSSMDNRDVYEIPNEIEFDVVCPNYISGGEV
jgi:hypothetical protein